MFFYAIFAISMWISPAWRRQISCIVILLLISLQFIWSNKSNDIFQFYSSTIMIEFIYGLLIGIVGNRISIGKKALAATFLVAVMIFGYAISYEIGRLHQLRFLLWGAPAALVVACVISADLRGIVPANRLFLLLGNSSYALYLTHLFALGGVRSVWPMMPQVLKSSDVFLITASVMASLAVGIGFYFIVEKPLVRLARSGTARIMSGKRQVRPAIAD